jgi:tetratricopeptide (TPR) repeat protein
VPGGVPEARAGIDPGVGEGDVEPAIGLGMGIEGGGDGIEIGNVEPVETDLVSGLAQAGSLKAAANAQYKQGDVAGACAEYERARALVEPVAETSVEKAPLLLALRLNSANCALQAKSFVDALAHTDAAIALSPQSVKAHFRRGQALQALGRVPEAEAAYSEVLKLEPANREVSAKLQGLRS